MQLRVNAGDDLPPYDDLAKCVKCGSSRINTTFCSQHQTHNAYQDYLCRTCQNCHFQWAEAPIDVKSVKDRHGLRHAEPKVVYRNYTSNLHFWEVVRYLKELAMISHGDSKLFALDEALTESRKLILEAIDWIPDGK